jgi:spore coat protein U-like protein
MKKALFLIAAVFALSATVTPAVHAQTSATIAVSATVAQACLISAGPLAFGSYSGAALTGSTTITLTCTAGAPVTILLNEGVNAPTGTPQSSPVRRMKSTSDPTQLLSYQLYIAAPGTTVWGNTLASGKPTTGQGAPEFHTVFGLIPGSQFGATAGVYADTVTASFSF